MFRSLDDKIVGNKEMGLGEEQGQKLRLVSHGADCVRGDSKAGTPRACASWPGVMSFAEPVDFRIRFGKLSLHGQGEGRSMKKAMLEVGGLS